MITFASLLEASSSFKKIITDGSSISIYRPRFLRGRRDSSDGPLSVPHLGPVKAGAADIPSTAHKKVVFFLSRSRELARPCSLPVSCHHHKRRRAGHGCRADPPPSRERPLLLHVPRLNPLHLAVHRLLNSPSSPPAPFPSPRLCCRVTFRATTCCFVFQQFSLLQVGGGDG
jgi:hypothetical protein